METSEAVAVDGISEPELSPMDCFLPEFTVKEEIEKGVLFEIRTDLPGVKMYHQLLYHKNKWMTPQMKAFLDLVLAQPGFREKAGCAGT